MLVFSGTPRCLCLLLFRLLESWIIVVRFDNFAKICLLFGSFFEFLKFSCSVRLVFHRALVGLFMAFPLFCRRRYLSHVCSFSLSVVLYEDFGTCSGILQVRGSKSLCQNEFLSSITITKICFVFPLGSWSMHSS